MPLIVLPIDFQKTESLTNLLKGPVLVTLERNKDEIEIFNQYNAETIKPEVCLKELSKLYDLLCL